MRAARAVAAWLCAAAAAAGAAHGESDDRMRYTTAELESIYRHSPLPAPPAERRSDDERTARLGQRLFFDRRLSPDGTIACATCHAPEQAYADGRRLARGLAEGPRNTPTILNAAYNRWFFWDGRADSLWSQALAPIENPKEFGGDRLHTLHTIARVPRLEAAYEEAFGPLPALHDRRRFPGHATPEAAPGSAVARAWNAMSATDRDAVNRAYANVGKAIAAYERKLVSGDSAFDRYVSALKRGDRQAQRIYPEAAKRGLKLFVGRAGCELCHSGPAFTDGEFHNIGLPQRAGAAGDAGRAAGISMVRTSPFNAAGAYADADGAARDRLRYLPAPGAQLGSFKTPGLRHVALTAPYMHDGRFDTLAEVLAFYAEDRPVAPGEQRVGVREATLDLLPRLTAAQRGDLVAFLRTLTGAPVPRDWAQPQPDGAL